MTSQYKILTYDWEKDLWECREIISCAKGAHVKANEDNRKAKKNVGADFSWSKSIQSVIISPGDAPCCWSEYKMPIVESNKGAPFFNAVWLRVVYTVHRLSSRDCLSKLYSVQFHKLYLFVCQQRERRGVLFHWSAGGAVTLHCLTIVRQ